MTNLFVQGQQVVFRMWGVDVTTGGNALTNKNVAAAYVTIPGVSSPITLSYATHGTSSYWTGSVVDDWLSGRRRELHRHGDHQAGAEDEASRQDP